MIQSCDHGDAIVVYETVRIKPVSCPMCEAENEIGELQKEILGLKTEAENND